MSKKAELVGSHFPTIYLTVISLLQGISLSQLVPNMLEYINTVDDPWNHIPIVAMLLMLLVIFIVWHHYAIGIFFLRWFPNIIDTIIPFFVSIAQFYLISLLKVEKSIVSMEAVEAWTLGYAAMLIFGSLGYFAASWRIDATLFTNLMSLEHGIIHEVLTRKYFKRAGFSILGQGVFALILYLTDHTDWLMISVILMMSHLVIFEIVLIRSIKPHFMIALDEFEEDEKKV
jgi:hypothetical protein